MSNTAAILEHVITVCDWLQSIGASQDSIDALITEIFDVYGVHYDDY